MNSLRRFKGKTETSSPEIAVCHCDPLAVGSQDGFANEQTETGAFAGPTPLSSVEAVENERPVLLWHTGAAVFNDHLDQMAALDPASRQGNDPFRRTKADRIGNNVVKRPG